MWFARARARVRVCTLSLGPTQPRVSPSKAYPKVSLAENWRPTFSSCLFSLFFLFFLFVCRSRLVYSHVILRTFSSLPPPESDSCGPFVVMGGESGGESDTYARLKSMTMIRFSSSFQIYTLGYVGLEALPAHDISIMWVTTAKLCV